jgi:DNA-binding NtrC family response regulator
MGYKVDKSQTILVVDDEAAQRELMGGYIQSLGFSVQTAASAEEALQQVQQAMPDMLVLDVRLPGMSGLEALQSIREMDDKVPVLLVTAYADLRQAVDAMKTGADDYLAKPIDLEELNAAITDALGPAADDAATRPVLPELPPGVIGESPAMRHLIETAAVVARSDVPVLILGPSGSGKEVIANLIHSWSDRADQPLVAANCAGLPDSLIESELFGHTKGAFTGATTARAGLFRSADSGTLFLDELGELPLALQPKFLRALETRRITPVGSDREVAVDVRLITATNRDLAEAVEKKEFREDLYYRINVMELTIPPLSSRREDIPQLARMFATEYTGGPARLSPQAMSCLLAHSWTGNVRELRNAIQRACLLCRGDIILPEHLPPKMAGLTTQGQVTDGDTGRLSQVERATILATLKECDGNRTQAAKKLGISRRALIYKLREIELQ